MAELVIGHPNEKQERFFEATQKYIAYGGARGGGKSWALRIKLILLALNYEGIQMLLLRRTYPELQENHIVQLKGILHDIATYHTQEKVFIFPNGSRLKMGYCKREDDVLQFQGQAYDVIAIDEATHFTEFQFQALTESNRASGLCKKPFSPRMYFTCNPGGVGHQWVKRLFVDKNYTGREIPENYNFIPALVYDNKAFLESDPEYVAVLEALPEKRRKAMLYGDWNAIEGAFFDEFMNNPDGYKTRINTHVIDPFDIPDHWRIYRSYDHGFSRPYSVGYWAVSSTDGTIFRIAELYGCTGTANEGVKQAPQDIFRTMREFESSHPHLKDRQIIGGVADPSIWNASSGKSVAEHAAEHGIYFTRGDNKRVAGWMEVRARLAMSNGKPSLYIFSNCKAAIRTIPIMMYAQHGDPEDLDTDMEDH